MSSGEFSHNDVRDVNSLAAGNGYREIRPERQMSPKELNSAVEEEFIRASKETKVDKGDVRAERNLDPSHKDCFTTSEERMDWAADRSEGEWEGEPGNSKFHPDKQEARDALDKYNQDGIDYHDGEPDFENVSEATVEIDHMTSERYGLGNNFDQANQKCAEKWNQEAKDGRTDWKPRDVENWRIENRYTWHERLDRKTMDLVQRDIHEECKHFGGVAECKRYEATAGLNGGEFDE